MRYNRNILRKLSQYLRDRLGMYNYRRGWMKGDCPYCQEHKFGVNLSSNRTNCFKCGANPRPIQVIMDVEGFLNVNEALIYLRIFEGVDFYEEAAEPFDLRDEVFLPEGFKNILRGESTIARRTRQTLAKRGFNVQDLAMKGWGYCDTGKYFGYLIMPYYIAGKLVYFNARKIIGDGPKFNNPLVEDFGLGKNMLIYNLDALGLYRTNYIFESVMNAETLGDNAIATGGKNISNYQVNVFIKSPTEKFIIGLDDDAMEEAIKLAFKLKPYKKVKILQFPKGLDANDIGRKKTLNLAHRSRYLRYNEILKLKNSL